MNFLVNLQNLREFEGQALDLTGKGIRNRSSQRIGFADALDLGGFHPVHAQLEAVSEDGVIDWARFDITAFGKYMPSMATFDAIEGDGGALDFRYGFCGDNINRVAKRPLRGRKLSEVLTGASRDDILAEYAAVLREEAPSASSGTVDISDMTWVRYLRFLYPARRNGEVSRLLAFMLFASRKDDKPDFQKTTI